MSFSRIISALGFRQPVNNVEASKKLYDGSFPEFREFNAYFESMKYIMTHLKNPKANAATGKTVSIMMDEFAKKIAAIAHAENDLSLEEHGIIQNFHADINEIYDLVISKVSNDALVESIRHNKNTINANMKHIFRGAQELDSATPLIKPRLENISPNLEEDRYRALHA